MKKLTFTKLLNIIAVMLVLTGVVVLWFGARARATNATQFSQPIVPAASETPAAELPESIVSGIPQELSIPSIGLQKTIVDGVFNAKSQKWTLSLDKVHFASMTTKPNDKRGMTFMYGHNRKEVFAKLPKIRPGTEAVVRTEDGLTFRYALKERRVVTPEDASIFAYDGAPILVLQTCTGAFFQNRELFIFDFIGVEHA